MFLEQPCSDDRRYAVFSELELVRPENRDTSSPSILSMLLVRRQPQKYSYGLQQNLYFAGAVTP